MTTRRKLTLDDAAIDIEREGGEDSSHVSTEESPLLNTNVPPDTSPSQSFQHLVVSMCVLFLFIVDVSGFMMNPPLQQVLEDRICARFYLDHELGVESHPQGRCKDTLIQKELAMLRSWDLSAGMLVPFFVQIPYGILADKYGRRPVLVLAILGCFLQLAWVLFVLSLPSIFSAWSIIYGNLALLVGGGPQMAAAMVWTLLSDAIPVARRTSIFYMLSALILIINVVINPISALLLSINPWIALWLSFGILSVGVCASLLVPETLALRQKVDMQNGRDFGFHEAVSEIIAPRKSWIQHAVLSAKMNVGRLWHFVVASEGVLILVIADALVYPIRMNLTFNLLQYMTKRFDWKWSTATYVSNVSNIAAVVTLLGILPLASSMLVKRFSFGPLRRDLLLARISMVFVIIGCLCTALAPDPWLFIAALIITSVGAGFMTLCKALLNAIVEPHAIATLNTAISMTEIILGFVSSPVLGWLLSKGLELRGLWTGLPYLICAALALFAGVATAIFRIPKGFDLSS